MEFTHIKDYEKLIVQNNIELLKEYREILESRSIPNDDKISKINMVISSLRTQLINIIHKGD